MVITTIVCTYLYNNARGYNWNYCIIFAIFNRMSHHISTSKIWFRIHFLQKMRCLCWMKWTIETPQNLPYFWNSKTYVLVFFVFHDYVLCFSPNQLSRYLKKTKWIVFIFQKIWQIFKHLYARKSHFIKHKPLTSGEWRNKWTWY